MFRKNLNVNGKCKKKEKLQKTDENDEDKKYKKELVDRLNIRIYNEKEKFLKLVYYQAYYKI